MKKLFVFEKFLTEKLQPSQFRKYVSEFNKDRYKDIFTKYKEKYDGDRNAYRIYLPLKSGENEVKNKIENFLNNNDYEIIDYIKGICKYKSAKNQSTIGKVLTKLNANDLLKSFVEDPRRKAGNDLLVCISRHPYDIAGSDTDRDWTNCMTLSSSITSPRLSKKNKELAELKKELEELKDSGDNDKVDKLKKEIKEIKEDIEDRKEKGENVKYLIHDVKEGSLISYLIKKDDKNIQDPIAVLNIKPFFNVKDKTDFVLMSDNRMYGNGTKEFKLTVDNWLEKVNKNKHGNFKLSCKLYNDGRSEVKILSDEAYKKNKTSLIRRIKRSKSLGEINQSKYYSDLRKSDIKEILKLLKDYSSEYDTFPPVRYIASLYDKNSPYEFFKYIMNIDDEDKKYKSLKNCIYSIYNFDKELLKQIPKNIIFKILKDPNLNGNAINILNNDYILNLFSSDEYIEIFHNEAMSEKIAHVLGKGKISLSDLISKIGLDNIQNYLYDIFEKIFNSEPIFDANKGAIKKLIDENKFEVRKNKSPWSGYNFKLIFNGNLQISIRKWTLDKLSELGLKTPEKGNYEQELKKVFEKNNWIEIKQQLESDNDKMVTKIILFTLNGLSETKNSNELESFISEVLHKYAYKFGRGFDSGFGGGFGHGRGFMSSFEGFSGGGRFGYINFFLHFCFEIIYYLNTKLKYKLYHLFEDIADFIYEFLDLD